MDAVIWSIWVSFPTRYEQAKYYTDINLAPTVLETCVNRKPLVSCQRLEAEWCGLAKQKWDWGGRVHGAFRPRSLEIYRKNKVEMISD